jgi:alpha-glucuronidase
MTDEVHSNASLQAAATGIPRRLSILVLTSLSLFAMPGAARADNGENAWLRYARLQPSIAAQYRSLPKNVLVLGDSPLLTSARNELIGGLQDMLGDKLKVLHRRDTRRASIVLGTIAEMEATYYPPNLGKDGFVIERLKSDMADSIVVMSTTDRGVLYGTFALLRKIAEGESLENIDDVRRPSVPLRWINQWDNLNGTIERGYGGRSVFFDHGTVRQDLTRANEYGRLLASVGINGCAVNNVNADPRVLTDDFLSQVARIADAFRPWGVRLALSVNIASPKLIGGLDTYDPLDPRVIAWWRAKVDQIYRLIPDFGGFVVKADSEGIPGPSSYGRSPADAANVIARALKPHGGVIFYRAFVYNHHLDWRDSKADRARAAYDIFRPLDSQFDDNVIVQIKYGPIDFQVREPAQPLFAGLHKTNEAIELQVTQEYTGQQRHLCFLAPLWKEILDFDMHVNGAARPTPVKDLIAGRVFHQPLGGFAGVANVGLDANWMGNPLALANLYAFGRLAWNPNLSAKQIIDEWTRLTFGTDPVVVKTISQMQLSSWRTYEDYTGPLGLGTLTNILGAHYGPDPQSAERNGWGQWLRADHDGVGMDRTIATGTGFIGQYPPAVQSLYETLANCPDHLLLFFHHVPYSYKLHRDKTVIQYIYDSHYEGAARAQQYVPEWESLRGRIDLEHYQDILALFEYQAGHAIVWRDAICDWFYRLSGIPDARGRVGHHPNRVEAESMKLDGYVVTDVTPWETASDGKAVVCPEPLKSCAASLDFHRSAGQYDLGVEYFDQNNGQSHFRVFVNDKPIDEWIANGDYPSNKPDGDTSTRRRIRNVALRPGDQIRIEGVPDAGERAPLDYVRIIAARRANAPSFDTARPTTARSFSRTSASPFMERTARARTFLRACAIRSGSRACCAESKPLTTASRPSRKPISPRI